MTINTITALKGSTEKAVTKTANKIPKEVQIVGTNAASAANSHTKTNQETHAIAKTIL